MSATTMLPTFDTQMMDYPSDIDIPMNSSTSESWYLGDLAMEDDPQTPQPKANAASGDRFIPTVEVDMEDWAPEPVEYEMADEAGVPYEDGAPLDVEVYDVSQLASQIHTPSGLDVARPLPENLAPPPHTLSPSFSPSVEIPMLPESDDDTLQIAHHAHDGLAVETLEESSYNTVAEASEVESSNVESFPPPTTEDFLESHATAGDPSLPADNGSSKLPNVANDTVVPPTDDAYDSADRHESYHDQERDVATHPSAPVSHTDQSAPSDGEHVALLNHHSDLHEEEYGHDPNVEEAVGSHERLQQVDQQASADPHEISEGVYIDPPPAVLLSFTLPDEESEYYLFNQPSRSGASTPSTDTHHRQHKMLLHEKPTLYYEPLASVFEALRMEPEVAQLPDFVNGELVLNAYDLDLSVSEDNVYAREISLHDLNVLHDGSKFTGPLRIHLHSVTPRFIFRYHEIQYQIAQGNSSAETADPSVTEQHEPHGQHQEETHQIEGQVTEEGNADHSTRGAVWQYQLSHESEEQVAGENVKTGEITNLSDELSENPGQAGEVVYLTDASEHNSGADNGEAEHQHEQNGSSTTLDVSDPSAAFHAGEDELHQVHDVHTDEPSEFLIADGELRSADDGADDDEFENVEEDFSESTDRLDVHESTSHVDVAAHEDVNVSRSRQLSEDSSTRTIVINETIHGGHEEVAVNQPAVYSPDDFADVLSNNVVDTTLDPASAHYDDIELEQDGSDKAVVPETHITVEIGSSIIAQPGSDRPADDPESRGDEWDEDIDGEGDDFFYDAWEAEHDAESNESSVTLSSTSSKRTHGQVEPDEPEADHESLYSTSRPKRLRSQYQPE